MSVCLSVYMSVCLSVCMYLYREKEEEIWLSPMTKAPAPKEKSQKQRDNTKRHQKLWLHNDCGPT